MVLLLFRVKTIYLYTSQTYQTWGKEDSHWSSFNAGVTLSSSEMSVSVNVPVIVHSAANSSKMSYCVTLSYIIWPSFTYTTQRVARSLRSEHLFRRNVHSDYKLKNHFESTYILFRRKDDSSCPLCGEQNISLYFWQDAVLLLRNEENTSEDISRQELYSFEVY